MYYENGKDIKTVLEITQDYSQKGIINYILNGKLKSYDKQGRLQAIFNFKNDSIAGLPQELYYPNRKVKYYAIAKDNNQKNPTFTQKAISYYDTMIMDRKRKIVMKLIVECGCVRSMIRMGSLKGKCRKVGNR